MWRECRNGVPVSESNGQHPGSAVHHPAIYAERVVRELDCEALSAAMREGSEEEKLALLRSIAPADRDRFNAWLDADLRKLDAEEAREFDLATGRGLVCVPDTEIRPESVDWYWEGRIAKGKLVLLEGDPDLGKSLLSMAIATSFSLGVPLPGQTVQRSPMNTLVIHGEDDPRDTTTPRLIALGADRSRIFHVQSGPNDEPFTLGTMNAELHRTIVQLGIAFCVMDPMNAFLPPSVDSHNDGDVRTLLRPLSSIAADTGCAIMAVRHLKKGASAKAIMAGAGALSALAAARLVLSVWEDPDNPLRRLLAVTKCNIYTKVPTLAYRIGTAETAVNAQPIVLWDGTSSQTANELSASRDTVTETGGTRRDAEEFLRGALGSGGLSMRDLLRLAKSEGFSERTLQRAASRMGVTMTRRGTGKDHTSFWELPKVHDRNYPRDWDDVTAEEDA